MIHGDGVSYYPKSGMIRLGRMLFEFRRYKVSDRYWREFIEMSPTITCVCGRQDSLPFMGHDVFWKTCKISYISGTTGTLHVRPSSRTAIPVTLIWRAQRAVKRFLKRRFEQRALALCMSHHTRLGSGACTMACLPPDILAMCVK